MVVQRSFLVACALVLFSLTVARAQSTVPNILGHWDAVEGSHALYNGEMEDKLVGTIQIEFTDQIGYAFSGTISWAREEPDNSPIYDGTELVPQAQEMIVGAFSGDGASFVMVEHPDTTLMLGKVLDDNRLEVVIAKSGKYAVAARIIYERRQ